MKAVAFGIVLAAAASLSSISPASALDIDVGPGGFHVGRHHHYDHWRGAYAYSPGDCRVIISRHLNRFGERVTVRRRVCD
jgi:hypothetical protein